MQLSEYKGPSPEAFRGFLEGVENLQDYLRTNAGEKLSAAEKRLSESLTANPDFAAAKYYQAIVFTHERRESDARFLLEGLNKDDSPFQAEVLYNLAFAYAREYNYELVAQSLPMLDKAYCLAHRQLGGLLIKAKRPELALLILAMRAWVMAVFAGRTYGHKEDFEKRRRELLPQSAALSQSVLSNPRVESLAPEARSAVEVEAHNAAGIVYMRMGQYSSLFASENADPKPGTSFVAPNYSYWFGYDLPRLGNPDTRPFFGKTADQYWALAAKHYEDALALHPRDVRVLDNITTLRLIQASHSWRVDRSAALRFSEQAKVAANTAISNNRHDRFRHNNLARALVLLGEWDAAALAADEVLKERGKVKDASVAELKEAIKRREVCTVLEAYPAA